MRGEGRCCAPKRPAEYCRRGQWERRGHLTTRSQPRSAPGHPAAPGLRWLGQGSRSRRRWDPRHLVGPGYGACACARKPPWDGGARRRAGQRGNRAEAPAGLGGSSPLCLDARGAQPGQRRSRSEKTGGPRRGGRLCPVTSSRDPRPTPERGGGSRASEGRTKRTRAPSGGQRARGQASARFLQACGPDGVRRPDSGSLNPSPLLREPGTGCKWIPSNPRGRVQARRPHGGGCGPPRGHPGRQRQLCLPGAVVPPPGSPRRGRVRPGTRRETEKQHQGPSGSALAEGGNYLWPPAKLTRGQESLKGVSGRSKGENLSPEHEYPQEVKGGAKPGMSAAPYLPEAQASCPFLDTLCRAQTCTGAPDLPKEGCGELGAGC